MYMNLKPNQHQRIYFNNHDIIAGVHRPPLKFSSPKIRGGGEGGAATMQVVQEILQNNYQRSILKTQKLEILSPLFEIS